MYSQQQQQPTTTTTTPKNSTSNNLSGEGKNLIRTYLSSPPPPSIQSQPPQSTTTTTTPTNNNNIISNTNPSPSSFSDVEIIYAIRLPLPQQPSSSSFDDEQIIIKDTSRVIVGGSTIPLIIENTTLSKFLSFSTYIKDLNNNNQLSFYLPTDMQDFKTALRLARERDVDPILKRSRNAIDRVLRCGEKFGLRDLDLIERLRDKRAVLSVNAIMPEIGASLETNPRRKLLLYKQVIQKSRTMDLVSGGTQSVQVKAMKIKVSESLLKVCRASTITTAAAAATTTTTTNTSEDTQQQRINITLQMLTYAYRILFEGRNEQLPQKMDETIKQLKSAIEKEFIRFGESPDQFKSTTLQRAISTSSDLYIDATTTSTTATNTATGRSGFIPPPPFIYSTLVPVSLLNNNNNQTTNNSQLIHVNIGGEKIMILHRSELEQIGCIQDALLGYISTTNNNSGPSTPVMESIYLFIGDEPERFEQMLHLVRANGHLESGEKMDESILRSYRNVARRYRLGKPIVEKLSSWLEVHKNGVGGSTDAKQELRALKITRLLNGERGDALVASSMAEAYVERMQQTSSMGKKIKFASKAELLIRLILPYLLTSASIVSDSGAGGGAGGTGNMSAVKRSIEILKLVLSVQGRADEISSLDLAIKEFTQGIKGAAGELADVLNGPTRDVPPQMYV
jgi:hypothetical protein